MSRTPTRRSASASSRGHASDDVEDVNAYGVTPHTPCWARLRATAMWMYASSSAYTRWPPVWTRAARSRRKTAAASTARAASAGPRRAISGLPRRARARGHARAGHGDDLVPAPRAVAGIHQDGQMAELLHHRDGGDVESVAGGVLEGADAALAEDDLLVAPGQDVLRGQQQLLDGRAQTALEQHRTAHLAEVLQEVEVLHVARADLVAVDVAAHHLDVARVHDLADHGQAALVGGRAHPTQRLLSMALEGVGRGAGLEGAAAQHARAGGRHRLGHARHLLLALDRAGAGHDDDLGPTHLDPGDVHDRVRGLEGPPHQLVGRGDLDHLAHTRDELQRRGVHHDPRRAHRAQHGVADAGGPVHVVAHLHQRLDDLLYLLFRRRRLHHDHHGILNLLFHRHRGPTPAPVRPRPAAPGGAIRR